MRRVTPEVRSSLPASINMHSVKNRFLMRIKNITPGLYSRNLFSITFRDAVVLGCCLLREHSSLRAFTYVIKNWKRVFAKRREIMRRRRVTDEYIASWFNYEPVSLPVRAAGKTTTGKPAPRTVSRQRTASR